MRARSLSINCYGNRTAGFRSVALLKVIGAAKLALLGVTLTYSAGNSAVAQAQQPTAAPLVLDGVTVIDVQQGGRLTAQRVVIEGNHIKSVGSASTVKVPAGAKVVNASGKYLIPGLWDLHTHSRFYTSLFYPLFLANGVTGIRDGWSEFGLDTLIRLRREILAGTRVGPPRQLLAGPALDQCANSRGPGQGHICVANPADARHVVDSLKAAGADYIKTYGLKADGYFAVASEARRIGIPFGGHLTAISAIQASDSGAWIIDHLNTSGSPGESLYDLCIKKSATDGQCQSAAERFRHNNTWFVPTLMRFSVEGMGSHRSSAGDTVLARFHRFAADFWSGSTHTMDLHGGPLDAARLAHEAPTASPNDSGPAKVKVGILTIAHSIGLPILAGTDDGAPVMKSMPPGFTLHAELALYVAEGLTPLEALQTATINPAKSLHATDSLGTVAAGKLADLVLLDADPLQDIANTMSIRAVIANGRYFDRAALDKVVADVQTEGKDEQGR